MFKIENAKIVNNKRSIDRSLSRYFHFFFLQSVNLLELITLLPIDLDSRKISKII